MVKPISHYRQLTRNAMTDNQIDRFFDACEDEMMEKGHCFVFCLMSFALGAISGVLIGWLIYG